MEVTWTDISLSSVPRTVSCHIPSMVFCLIIWLCYNENVYVIKNINNNNVKLIIWKEETLPVDSITHWGRVTHICVISSDNGLSHGGRQAFIRTKAGILLIGPLGTNFRENLIAIQTFSLKKIRLKMPSAKCCLFRSGLNATSWALEDTVMTDIDVTSTVSTLG